MRRLCGLLPGVVLATVWSVPIPPGAADQGILPFTGLDNELSALRDEVVRLRAENARLQRLLELTPQQARPPGPVQTGVFDGEPDRYTPAPPPLQRLPSTPASSPLGPTSTRCDGRTRVPAVPAGCPRCAAAGARAFRPPSGT